MERLVELSYDGEITGRSVERNTAKESGCSYGVAYVMITCGNNILVQVRSPNKKSQPNLSDLSAGGHIDLCDAENTSNVELVFRQAAVRELKEELGIQMTPNEIVHKLSFHESMTSPRGVQYRKYFQVFSAEIDKLETNLKYDRNEIADLNWIAIPELNNLSKRSMTKELNRYISQILSS